MGEQDRPQPATADEGPGEPEDAAARRGAARRGAAAAEPGHRPVANGPETDAFDDPDEPGGLVSNTDDEAPSG